MLKELMSQIKAKIKTEPPTSPAQKFSDPLAARVEWTPAKGGGANFCTHRLKVISTSKIVFRVTAGAQFFYGIFLCAGLGVMTVGIVNFTKHGLSVKPSDLFVPLLFGLVFAGVGGALMYFGNMPIVFDKATGYFWKSRKNPGQEFNPDQIKNKAHLSDIHAIQLISEYCSGSKSHYYSYELNLVLKNSTRLSVVDHGSRVKLREDAKALSQFLNVPLWDAIPFDP